MGIYLWKSTFKHTSGLPADDFHTTRYFEFTGTPTSTDYGNLSTLLQTYITGVVPTTTRRIADSISSEASRASGGIVATAYLLPAAPGPIGSPDYSYERTNGFSPTGTSIPAEVAAVVSVNASLVDIPEESGDTRPRARRRNRQYIGPLTTNAFGTISNAVRLSDQFRSDLVVKTKELWASASSAGWQWRAFSHTDWLGRALVGGFVDNAADTQRRRGPKSSARDIFFLP